MFVTKDSLTVAFRRALWDDARATFARLAPLAIAAACGAVAAAGLLP